jgi:hypothetical protein
VAEVAAQIGQLTPLMEIVPPPGRTEGLQTTSPNHYFEVDTIPITWPPPAVQDTVVAGGAPGLPAAAPGEVVGQVLPDERFNTGLDWFEMTHIFPDDTTDNPIPVEKSTIDFGNILAQGDEVYEVYNAHRKTLVVLSALSDDVTPGIETPDVTPLVNITAQTSILGPTSTFNTQLTSGLGVPVKTVVRALLDGLPNFDGSIEFTLGPGNDVSLFVTGSRIALLTAEFDGEVKETMSWLTDIFDPRDGGEQRISLRKQPREGYNVAFALDDVDNDERQRMQAQLFDWQDSNFGLPMWHEQLRLTAAASASATQFQVSGADDVDLRVGGLFLLFKDPYTFDVLTLQSATDTLITATSGSANAYAANDRLMPVRVARIVRDPKGRRHPVTLENFRIQFEVTDNDTGAPAADASAFNTYLTKILFDDCNLITGPVPETFERRVIVIDNGTGIISQTSPWDRNKRKSRKGFVASTRAAIKSLKAALRAIRGRQTSFYMPTFIEDMTVKADLGSGAATMDISHIGYVRFIRDREPKATFRITFTDGTSLERIVQSSAAVDSTTERLTLNATWPAARTVAEIQRVEFYELMRFDTDSLTLTYPRIGLARMFAPVKVVFDTD